MAKAEEMSAEVVALGGGILFLLGGGFVIKDLSLPRSRTGHERSQRSSASSC